MLPVLDNEAMREADRHTIEDLGVPGLVLMENAATGVVAAVTFRGDVIGIVYVDRPVAKKPFTSTHLQYCIAAGAQIGATLAASARKL